MKKIVFFKPELKINENLTIIGSSKYILNKKKGHEIDKFDEIIRFNTATTDSYEEFVGKKTTLRVINNHLFLESMKLPKDKVNRIAVINPNKFLEEEKKFFSRDKKKYFFFENKINQFLLSFFFIKYLSIFFRLLFLIKKKNFSVGFLTILSCIASGLKPTLYGFDINEDMENRSHYYMDGFPIGRKHNLEEEHKIIKLLKDKNLLFIK